MSDIEERVMKVVAETLNVEQSNISLSSAFVADLDADSLDTVELIMGLESEFDLTAIPDEKAEKMTTVQHAVDFIREATGGE